MWFKWSNEGYQKVKTTPKAGDYGVDLIVISPEGKKVGFQCKRYKKNVGSELPRLT